ncbi:winged helix-turn-helix domain-containing protein [Sulfuracidifex tepidarius]|uniref:ArnR1-like winged helix-turn-helix domain-containing protein n=1 Tax=Sulfuracidifex tepidarius TaxID=1294262 RepID=A0A510E5B7_9CREN|nr:winged helix-turn-helix domain-containing protein [Sulfuracidifex tepidarius]BBG24894.1 hypothetical protein IC006_2228 [Sulfuracidifex tepidarius]BBG27679.1 hypothetical protein IC007_2233 [Sulfuracidifex tepidarius]
MKRRARRNKIAIIKSILSASIKETQKTSLMYAANLNHKTITGYLSDLIKSDLIIETGNKAFQTTDKGKMILKKIEEYERHIQEAEKIKSVIDEVLNKGQKARKPLPEYDFIRQRE